MLKGKKIFLRRFDECDLEKNLGWINDAEIFVTMGILGPRTKKAQERWYESVFESKTNIVFAICREDDKEYIGNASIFDIDTRNRNAGLTIMLPEQSSRGKGYGTEAVRLLCDYAFEYLNLYKVYCKTDNPVAAKLYRSIGFIQEGVLRGHAYHYGHYIDKLVFGLLKQEYQSLQLDNPH